MKITKKAKRTIVTHVITETSYSKYECPSCKTEYIGTGININVTRFICNCGQELIIDKHI